jgi:hypothetical protein
VHDAGSPVWLTLIATAIYYGYAMLRGVASAELRLAFTLILAIRIGPQTVDLTTLSSPQLWPLITLIVVELGLGTLRADSLRVFIGLTFGIAAVYFLTSATRSDLVVQMSVNGVLWLISILVVGAIYRDPFAWLLRITGAPLIVLATMACAIGHLTSSNSISTWILPTTSITLAAIAFAYRYMVQMRLYQLSGLISAMLGCLDVVIHSTILLIRDSAWKGAGSFAFGLGWFVLAVMISSWKAGWLRSVGPWLRSMVQVEPFDSQILSVGQSVV